MRARTQSISYLGQTNARNRSIRFGVAQHDRLSHLYATGQTGVGKSSLLRSLAMQDVVAGRGFAVVDPHGDMVGQIYQALSPNDRERVIYLNAYNPSQPYGYNPLRWVRADKIPLAASGLLETLRKLWTTAWGKGGAKLSEIASLFLVCEVSFRHKGRQFCAFPWYPLC